MREILFRGKDSITKRWVYGALVQQQDDPLKEKAFIISYSNYQFGDFSEAVMHEVDPETVGQCTGFGDKNGNKIFEGDIVSICNSKTFFFIVYWNHAVKSFILKSTVNGVNGIDCNVLDSTQDIEVIGNIYDNPELIKDGE
jgi:uncharacterized phage protein (TIGR01671 family)